MNLCWNELKQKMIKEDIKLKTEDQAALQTAQKFNKTTFTVKDMHPSCWYVKAGFGNKTVNQINDECSKKFPDKTTKKLEANLPEDGVISFAYFLKDLKFPFPFAPCK